MEARACVLGVAGYISTVNTAHVYHVLGYLDPHLGTWVLGYIVHTWLITDGTRPRHP